MHIKPIKFVFFFFFTFSQFYYFIMHASTCTLPPLSDLFLDDHTTDYTRSTNSNSVLDISNLLSTPARNLKAKRKRASPNQLQVLNRIFNQTYFPSTEIRIELGKQLGMSPRTVQIWFQNKRQALRSRGRHTPNSPPPSFYLPPISPPRSPPSDIRYYNPSTSTISLPPLRMVSPQQQHYSPSMSYPSPNSIDQLHFREY
jgi:hypothetical protein